MPPKAKFTKEEVIAAALAILKEEGVNALTARTLGAKLGSSPRPIFTLFSGMEEVLAGAERAARDLYNGYTEEGLKEPIAFRGVGRAYIRFATKEPKLFRFLFMRERGAELSNVLPILDDNYRAILSSITGQYALSEEQARRAYETMWIFTHGIASLVATGVCAFTEAESDSMLTEVFTGLIVKFKTEGKA